MVSIMHTLLELAEINRKKELFTLAFALGCGFVGGMLLYPESEQS